MFGALRGSARYIEVPPQTPKAVQRRIAAGVEIEADAKFIVVKAGLGSRFKFCVRVFDPKAAVT